MGGVGSVLNQIYAHIASYFFDTKYLNSSLDVNLLINSNNKAIANMLALQCNLNINSNSKTTLLVIKNSTRLPPDEIEAIISKHQGTHTTTIILVLARYCDNVSSLLDWNPNQQIAATTTLPKAVVKGIAYYNLAAPKLLTCTLNSETLLFLSTLN